MINNTRYQSQVYEVARKRNTIAVMETGTGKTIIAVMLITEIGQAIKSSGDKKLIIFLAPTVHLVHQVFLSIPFLVMWLIGCLKLSILVEIECVFFFWYLQQFGVIKEHTSFEVEEYYGAKGVDSWDKEHWEKEFKTHDVSFTFENHQ